MKKVYLMKTNFMDIYQMYNVDTGKYIDILTIDKYTVS